MHVFHEVRVMAAEKLGRPLEEIRLDTSLGSAEPAWVEDLYQRLFLQLPEAGAGSRGEFQAATLSWQELGLSGGESFASVGALASIAVRSIVRLLVSDRLDVPPGDLTEQTHFTLDLGADSLTRVDLVLLLEEWLDVAVPDDSMALVQTVGDSELFALLYDHVREGLVLALGESVRDFAPDQPLADVGSQAYHVALEAASSAVGVAVHPLDGTGATVADVVRGAFLLQKLRLAMAAEAGVTAGGISGDTVPLDDLGLDAVQSKRVLDGLSRSLELVGETPPDGHLQPLHHTWRQLVTPGGCSQGRVR